MTRASQLNRRELNVVRLSTPYLRLVDHDGDSIRCAIEALHVRILSGHIRCEHCDLVRDPERHIGECEIDLRHRRLRVSRCSECLLRKLKVQREIDYRVDFHALFCRRHAHLCDLANCDLERRGSIGSKLSHLSVLLVPYLDPDGISELSHVRISQSQNVYSGRYRG